MWHLVGSMVPARSQTRGARRPLLFFSIPFTCLPICTAPPPPQKKKQEKNNIGEPKVKKCKCVDAPNKIKPQQANLKHSQLLAHVFHTTSSSHQRPSSPHSMTTTLTQTTPPPPLGGERHVQVSGSLRSNAGSVIVTTMLRLTSVAPASVRWR